jgi:hypothetical protein
MKAIRGLQVSDNFLPVMVPEYKYFKESFENFRVKGFLRK